MKGSTIGLIVVSALVLLIGGAFAFMFGSSEGSYRLGTPGGSGRSASTLSNVKQLGIALVMYATDYDDRLPVQMGDPRNLEYVLNPYVRNSSIFRTLNPSGGTIESNDLLAGAPYSEIQDMATTTSVFETNDWADGRRAVGFADTHAKLITGFDKVNDTKVTFSTRGQKVMDKLAEQLKPKEVLPGDPPPVGALGMPGG